MMEQRRTQGAAWPAGRTQTLVMTGLLTALGCAATLVLQVPSPTGGYLNLGDAVVVLGAYLLGPVFGAVAGGVGPALADLLSGYTAYVPATLVIKAVMGLLAAALYRVLGKKAWGVVVCALAAESVMAAGYWLFDGLLACAGGGGTWGVCLAASAAGIPSNLTQGAFGAAASTLLTLSLQRSSYVCARFPYFH